MSHEEVGRAPGRSSCAHSGRVFRGLLRMPGRVRLKGAMPDL